jgi:CheY-like chemotaxis protein
MEKVKILVVEDEVIIAKDIQASLQKMGYNACTIVSSGEEAIKKAEEEHPDLVLMDIVLQGEMDGIEAASIIRSRFDIPIVYLTSYADEETIERAKNAEPHGYLIKPFEEERIHVTIDLALHKYKNEKELKDRNNWLSALVQSYGETLIGTDKKDTA